ncbi:hypothetical protein HKX48_008874 [Thoreauomyces humboldtii]|nr:hypothetical protein HKX48_008874 [Thoreauomyces humboldtii]
MANSDSPQTATSEDHSGQRYPAASLLAGEALSSSDEDDHEEQSRAAAPSPLHAADLLPPSEARPRAGEGRPRVADGHESSTSTRNREGSGAATSQVVPALSEAMEVDVDGDEDQAVDADAAVATNTSMPMELDARETSQGASLTVAIDGKPDDKTSPVSSQEGAAPTPPHVTRENFIPLYGSFLKTYHPQNPAARHCKVTEHLSKFDTPPKNQKRTFETYDFFELVRELGGVDGIKSWSDLARRLGFDPRGTNIAARVKEWMIYHHIGAYFDYLLGIPNEFLTHPRDDPSDALATPDGLLPPQLPSAVAGTKRSSDWQQDARSSPSSDAAPPSTKRVKGLTTGTSSSQRSPAPSSQEAKVDAIDDTPQETRPMEISRPHPPHSKFLSPSPADPSALAAANKAMSASSRTDSDSEDDAQHITFESRRPSPAITSTADSLLPSSQPTPRIVRALSPVGTPPVGSTHDPLASHLSTLTHLLSTQPTLQALQHELSSTKQRLRALDDRNAHLEAKQTELADLLRRSNEMVRGLREEARDARSGLERCSRIRDVMRGLVEELPGGYGVSGGGGPGGPTTTTTTQGMVNGVVGTTAADQPQMSASGREPGRRPGTASSSSQLPQLQAILPAPGPPASHTSPALVQPSLAQHRSSSRSRDERR